MKKQIDCWHTRLITCPYCGWKNQDSWEMNGDGDEYTDTTECGKCEREFRYSVSISVEYTSEAIL